MKNINPSTTLRVNGERNRTIKFFTLGCKVNQYDTQRIREELLQQGFKELDNRLPADIYLINTCTVTERADSESLNLIRRAKKENPKAKIIVTGCLVELDSQRVLGERGVTLINRGAGAPGRWGTKQNGISYFKGHTRAFVKIQDGCNEFCSYCKVPLVRGVSRSRPLKGILQEVTALANNGYKEIVLTGICLGAYGRGLYPKTDITEVIGALEKIDGLLRIRLSSIEAADVSEKLINKIQQSHKLCRHLHIPLQSGDDEILKKMNRKYCRQDYLNLVKKIKGPIPEIAITTDVLVGFPSEDDKHFQNTLKLIKEILPLKVHIFPYSKREGTQAAINFKQNLNCKIIKERLNQLKDIAQECSLNYRRQFLNKDMGVLIEAHSKDNPRFWEGHTDNYIKVRVRSNFNLKNQLISVRIKGILKDYVLADLS